jgi:ABC-type polysaccharide/polyol phosphate export permease
MFKRDLTSQYRQSMLGVLLSILPALTITESQYFVGSDSFFGHSIKSHSSGYGSVRL